MIHAYLDDSGDSQYAVCGGILGAAEYLTFTETFWAIETLTLVKMSRRMEDRARLWFESGPTDADVLRAYNDVRDYKFPNALEQNRLAGLSFGDKTLIPLQAADLAARECFKASSNHGKRPTRKPLQRMWEHTGMVGLTEACLRRLKESGSPMEIKSIEAMHCRAGMVTVTPYSQEFEPL